jgi:hypothetical protein
MIFVRAADNTAGNRQSFAEIYANNGSGESVDDESKLFDSVTRLSTSGEEPAQVLGLNTPVKATMRDAMRSFLDTLSQSFYVVVANVDLPQYDKGEFMLSNLIAEWTGEYTWQDALDYLYAERELRVIEAEV